MFRETNVLFDNILIHARPISQYFRCYASENRGHTCRTNSDGYFFPNSNTTSFMSLHGSAHGAQKFNKDTRSRSAERISWKCAGDSTMYAFVEVPLVLDIVASIFPSQLRRDVYGNNWDVIL